MNLKWYNNNKLLILNNIQNLILPVHELEEVNVSSASGKKLKLDDSTSTSDVNDCNVIVNIELLKNVFEKLCT